MPTVGGRRQSPHPLFKIPELQAGLDRIIRLKADEHQKKQDLANLNETERKRELQRRADVSEHITKLIDSLNSDIKSLAISIEKQLVTESRKAKSGGNKSLLGEAKKLLRDVQDTVSDITHIQKAPPLTMGRTKKFTKELFKKHPHPERAIIASTDKEDQDRVDEFINNFRETTQGTYVRNILIALAVAAGAAGVFSFAQFRKMLKVNEEFADKETEESSETEVGEDGGPEEDAPPPGLEDPGQGENGSQELVETSSTFADPQQALLVGITFSIVALVLVFVLVLAMQRENQISHEKEQLHSAAKDAHLSGINTEAIDAAKRSLDTLSQAESHLGRS